MEVKEAIEFVREIKHSGNGYGNSYISDFNKLKDIISLLQQGDKYREMLEDIRLECNDTLIEFPKSKITYSFNDIFKMFKQKYFPKGV